MPEELIPQLSHDDRVVMESVLDESSSLKVAVPADIDADTLWRNLETCCRIAGRMTDAIHKLKPVIGRLLVVLQDHPSVYQERGYRTYEEFMAKGMISLFGISRTEAYALRKVAERNPSLTPEQFERIGTSKLYALSAHMQEGDAGYEEVVARAEDPKTTKTQLRELISQVTHNNAGDIQMTDLVIPCTLEQAKTIKEFVTNRYVHLFVGSTAWGEILRLAAAECQNEWVLHAMDLEKEAQARGIEVEVKG